MKGIREIKNRVKAVKNTAQITRAMQLVAASKMSRAQAATREKRSYSFLLADIMATLRRKGGELSHPLIDPRPVKRPGVLLISTDKGLCGPLNSNLFRLVTELDPSTRFVTIGRKATQFISRTGRDLMADFKLSDPSRFEEIRTVAQYLIDAYLGGEIDSLHVVFPRFKNTLVQIPVKERLLPLPSLDEELVYLQNALDRKIEGASQDARVMLFEPSIESLLEDLPALFLKQELFQMVREVRASEHSARMVAMKTASDNAKNLMEDLSLELNKARQAAITQEILEISAAAAH